MAIDNKPYFADTEEEREAKRTELRKSNIQ